MLAIWITGVLFLAALTTAFVVTWRRYATQPVTVEAEVEGPTCYPRAKR